MKYNAQQAAEFGRLYHELKLGINASLAIDINKRGAAMVSFDLFEASFCEYLICVPSDVRDVFDAKDGDNSVINLVAKIREREAIFWKDNKV